MAAPEEYAQWIVDNADKQGTDEFNTVVQAYEMSKQQMQQQTPAKEIGMAQAVQTALPAITPTGPTGIGQLAKEVSGAVSPYVKEAVSAATSGYKARPLLTAAVDTLGLGTVGAPVATAYNSVMGMADQFGRAKGAAQDVGKVLSQSALIESPKTGIPYPESVPAFREMQKIAPEIAQKLSEVYQKGGGNNAVKAWLASEEAVQFMKNPAFAQAAESYIGKVPGVGSQAMKVAGPLLRGAAKVAGPVGLGMNIYDAGQYAQESQLGPRLAQGQGRMAQQAFRNMAANQQYGGLTPEQQAMLEQDKIDQAIRRKAAQKVLGPVIPPGQ